MQNKVLMSIIPMSTLSFQSPAVTQPNVRNDSDSLPSSGFRESSLTEKPPWMRLQVPGPRTPRGTSPSRPDGWKSTQSRKSSTTLTAKWKPPPPARRTSALPYHFAKSESARVSGSQRAMAPLTTTQRASPAAPSVQTAWKVLFKSPSTRSFLAKVSEPSSPTRKP